MGKNRVAKCIWVWGNVCWGLMEDLKHTKQTIVSWPSPQDYNEAVQNPHDCLKDSSLAQAEAEMDALGLPRPNTGMFASVYRMRCSEGDWALRCFLHFVPDQVERYSAIETALRLNAFPHMLDFAMQERGVMVRGQWFPVLKMQWCQGETLDRWLGARLGKKYDLEAFMASWKKLMLSMKNAGIAHGDLQHGNILMLDNEIKLVDYDGMYVPALEGKLSNELGHRAYQHPGRSQEHFGPYLDNFSAWVIYLSVEILSLDPGLWYQLRAGDDCLLFRKRDFDDPLRSRAFLLTEKHNNADIRRAAKTIRYLLSLDPKSIPDISSNIDLPETLPALEINNELPDWVDDEFDADDDDESDSLEAEKSDLADFNAAEYSPAYVSKKRRRSRLKGGYSVPRPNRGQAPEAPPKRKALTHEQARLVDLTAKLRNEPNAALRALALSTSNPPEAIDNFEEGEAAVPLHQSFTHTMKKGLNLSWHHFALLGVSIFAVFAMFALSLNAIESRRHAIPTELRAVKISDRHAIPELKEADQLFNAGKYADARAQYEKVISLLGSKEDDFSKEQSAFAHLGIGDLNFLKNSYQEALLSYTSAEDLFRSVFGQDNFDDAVCFCRMGKVYEKQGVYDEARTSYQSAIETFEKLGVTPRDSVELEDAIKGRARVEALGE